MRAPLRPRLELVASEPPERLLERMARTLRANDCPVCGIVAADRVELHVPPARQLYALPMLVLLTADTKSSGRMRTLSKP